MTPAEIRAKLKAHSGCGHRDPGNPSRDTKVECTLRTGEPPCNGCTVVLRKIADGRPPVRQLCRLAGCSEDEARAYAREELGQ